MEDIVTNKIGEKIQQFIGTLVPKPCGSFWLGPKAKKDKSPENTGEKISLMDVVDIRAPNFHISRSWRISNLIFLFHTAPLPSRRKENQRKTMAAQQQKNINRTKKSSSLEGRIVPCRFSCCDDGWRWSLAIPTTVNADLIK